MTSVDSHCRLVKGFATASEVESLTRLIEARSSLFVETSGQGRLGPRYRIINGERIQAEMPAVLEFGDQRVRPVVEQLANRTLESAGTRASTRIQAFDHRDHDFRWHFDTHPYTGLLTLWNRNRSETHVISPGLSRLLRVALYPLYPFPRVFDPMPHHRFTMAAGDLLVMHGCEVLHRGVALADDGTRMIVAYGFVVPGARANPLRARAARILNYGDTDALLPDWLRARRRAGPRRPGPS